MPTFYFYYIFVRCKFIKDPGRGFRPNLIFLLEQVYVGENKLRKFHPSSSLRKVRASDQRMYCRNPQYCVNAYVTTLYLALYGVRLTSWKSKPFSHCCCTYWNDLQQQCEKGLDFQDVLRIRRDKELWRKHPLTFAIYEFFYLF